MDRYDPRIVSALRRPVARTRNFSDESKIVVKGELYLQGDCIKIGRKRYKLEKLLGMGGMAAVWLVSEPLTGEKFSMKVYIGKFSGKFSSDFPDELDANMDVHEEMDHSDIQKILHFDRERLIALLPYFEGVSPIDFLSGTSEVVRAAVVLLLAEKGRQMWEDGFKNGEIVHRDMKDDNILVQWGLSRFNAPELQFRLIDPDMMTRLSRLNGRQPCLRGTPLYMAPEVCSGRYEERSFLHELGVSLHRILMRDKRDCVVAGAKPVAAQLQDYLADPDAKFLPDGRRYPNTGTDVYDLLCDRIADGYSHNAVGRDICTSITSYRLDTVKMRGFKVPKEGNVRRLFTSLENVICTLTAYLPDDRVLPRHQILRHYREEHLYEFIAEMIDLKRRYEEGAGDPSI